MISNGGTYDVAHTFVDCPDPGVAVPARLYKILTGSGAHAVIWGGPLSIAGTLAVEDTMDMNGHVLTVGNNFGTSGPGGAIVMQAGETITVANDASFHGVDESLFLANGTLNLAGSFYQLSGQSNKSLP